jgi:dTDP-4-dehydrorhamnose reductase
VSQRVLVTGASGLLGGYLVDALEARDVEAAFVSGATSGGTGANWISVDLTDPRAIEDLWRRVTPDVVIHAAALTNVDLCERDPALADSVNRQPAESLARHASGVGARLVHISTDSVFDGQRGGYAEDDEPAPVNVYARTKLAAEQETAAVGDHLVLRSNFFGRSPRGHGLAEWLLRELAADKRIVGFSDVVFSPLFCGHFAEIVVDLALGDARGILHVGASNSVSKLEFAQLVAAAYGYDRSLVSAGTLRDVDLQAPRPLNTSLVVDRVEQVLGRSSPSIESGISAMHAAGPR